MADLRAQGVLGVGGLRRAVTTVFAAALVAGIYSRANGELHNAGGPRPVFLTAATLSMVCLLVANGLTAGRLSQTTGPTHRRYLRSLPISEFGAAAIVVLLTLARALLFALFFLAPLAAAGITSAHSPAAVLQCVAGFLVMPILPAALAGILARRATVAAPALLILVAMIVLTVGNVLAGARFPAPAESMIAIVAIPCRVLLGLATATEALTFVLVWALLTVSAYGALGFAGSVEPDAESTRTFPARPLLRWMLHRLRPTGPTVALIALGLARVPLAALVVLGALAAASGRLVAHVLTTRPVPVDASHPAQVAPIVVALAATAAAAYAVTLVLGGVHNPGQAERQALGALPLRPRSVILAAWTTIAGVATLFGLSYLVAWHTGMHATVGWTVTGWLACGWLGACSAVAPFALLQATSGTFASRVVRSAVGYGVLALHTVIAVLGGAMTGSAGGTVAVTLAFDSVLTVAGLAVAVRAMARGKV